MKGRFAARVWSNAGARGLLLGIAPEEAVRVPGAKAVALTACGTKIFRRKILVSVVLAKIWRGAVEGQVRAGKGHR